MFFLTNIIIDYLHNEIDYDFYDYNDKGEIFRNYNTFASKHNDYCILMGI